MSTAFLFPGQGAQFVGMGKDLYEADRRAKALFDEADEIMGQKLTTICFEGPEDELRQTKFTQPAIFVHSLAVYTMLGLSADCAAGHSLGEYSALVASGALSFRDGLTLVKKRGELMQESGTRSPGTMAAVIGAEEALVNEVCAEVATTHVVQPANFNSPGQIVISGSLEGIDAAMELLKSRGVRIVKKLPVSGAFHSPLMQYAADELGAVLEATPISDARFPVYTNVTAEPVTRAADIRAMLARQVTSPVLWERSMHAMVADGMTRAVEVGPGTVLAGLLKRIHADTPVQSVCTMDDIRAFASAE